MFTNLRVEVRSLLSTTADLAHVRAEFLEEGLFLLPQEHEKIHQSLLDIYAHTEAIVNDDSPVKPYDVFIQLRQLRPTRCQAVSNGSIGPRLHRVA